MPSARRALPLLLLPTLAVAVRSKRSSLLADFELIEPIFQAWAREGRPEAAQEPWESGRFQAEERLGSGAHGEAWLARDLRSGGGREVVIKLFKDRAAGGGYVRAGRGASSRRVAAEAERECGLAQRALAGKSSFPEGRRFVCACLESHARDRREGEALFLVLENCGESLLRRAEEGRSHGLAQARNWTRQALMALSFLAGLERPVAHRDVGAANVAVSGENGGTARLLDFGIAREGGHWRDDAIGWGHLSGFLLCAEGTWIAPTFPWLGRCGRSRLGLGREEDWRVVDLALAGQTAPRELLEMLPSAEFAREEEAGDHRPEWSSHLARGVARLFAG